jgi:hypothetical protein
VSAPCDAESHSYSLCGVNAGVAPRSEALYAAVVNAVSPGVIDTLFWDAAPPQRRA